MPLVIALDVPETGIPKEIRDLAGENGRVVLVALAQGGADAVEAKHRFGLDQGKAVLADEFGNPLKSGVEAGEDIADAFHELDELLAGLTETWNEALRRGRVLLESGKREEAARALSVFAFAAGTDTAAAGKKLFEEAAAGAREELERLVEAAGEKKAADLDADARAALIRDLTGFIERWPRTPLALAADLCRRELLATEVF
ncbi:MAG: hypothetical protein HY812_08655 [Planctomycetes bacterium]|nr:hypothetical protein [Planctomycetota bacterium]